jgi:hypothetical protein
MSPRTLFVLVLALCMVNGLFSPFLALAVPITAVLIPEFFPRTLEWVLFFSSILVSTATLLFSGVPAALYERLIARDETSTVSMYIWLGGAALLSAPAIQYLVRA